MDIEIVEMIMRYVFEHHRRSAHPERIFRYRWVNKSIKKLVDKEIDIKSFAAKRRTNRRIKRTKLRAKNFHYIMLVAVDFIILMLIILAIIL